MNEVVWTIAGSDSGGGAGIQADLLTFHDFKVHGCSVITALTAQNSVGVLAAEAVSEQMFNQQLQALNDDLPAHVLKLGMLAEVWQIEMLAEFLQNFAGQVICDPVFMSTSGVQLISNEAYQALCELIFPRADLITPNYPEALELLKLVDGAEKSENNPPSSLDFAELRRASGGFQETPPESITCALLSLGSKAVLLKGGHGLVSEHNGYCADHFLSDDTYLVLKNTYVDSEHTHGSGCSLSAAIAANLAKGEDLANAIVIANAYVHQGIRKASAVGQGPGPVKHLGWPASVDDLPVLAEAKPLSSNSPSSSSSAKAEDPEEIEDSSGLSAFADNDDREKSYFSKVEQSNSRAPKRPITFPKIERNIGFYPIVDTAEQVCRLVDLGVNSVQLRIKDLAEITLRDELQKAIAYAKASETMLFINDHWQLAIELGAYGVHLGQEDLTETRREALLTAGLRLGISSHDYVELARAHHWRPSYIALGPIYPTTTKVMRFAAQGLAKLAIWQALSPYPIVAIGGIDLERAKSITAQGVNGIAVISALQKSTDWQKSVDAWQALF